MIRAMNALDPLAGDCWPTTAQTWLLRAAFLPPEPARAAWEVWRAHAGPLEQLDEGSRRLLPVLYRNLRRSLSPSQMAEPPIPQFRERYRRTWFRNQASFYQIAGLLDGLHSAGLATMILKGAALAVLHYRDLGLRPMADLDIAVPAASALEAFAVLGQLGWMPTAPIRRPADFIGVKQSTDFRSTSGSHFDLHWHVLWDACYPGADDDFWAGAVPAWVNQVATRALNPTDQLTHVCVHGALLNRVPPVRWAADAMQILSAPGAALDWARLLAHAQRLRLSLSLRAALHYLRTVLDAPIPATVVETLAAMPVNALDRAFYRRKISRRGLLGEIPLMWSHYCLIQAAQQLPPTRPGFLRYMRLNWGLDDGRDIPQFVVNKFMRRLKAVSAHPDLEPSVR